MSLWQVCFQQGDQSPQSKLPKLPLANVTEKKTLEFSDDFKGNIVGGRAFSAASHLMRGHLTACLETLFQFPRNFYPQYQSFLFELQILQFLFFALLCLLIQLP